MPTTTSPWITRHNTHTSHPSHKSHQPTKPNWRFILATAVLTAAWFITALVLVELVGR